MVTEEMCFGIQKTRFWFHHLMIVVLSVVLKVRLYLPKGIKVVASVNVYRV